MAIYQLFIQHIMFSLSAKGKAAIVVPTGFVTAQTGIPKKIREKLVESRMLRGVISMPSNIFATTGTTSMLSINPAAVAAAVASLPRVQTAIVDRAFPNTLTIKIVPERAVAVTTTPQGRVVLAASGRVLGPATAGAMGLPIIASAPSDIPGAGGTVTAPGVVAELALAAARSRTLRFRAIGYGQDGRVGQTAQGVEVRVGDADQLATKLKVARSVLRRAGTTVQYVDVTVPAAPVLRESSADPLTANAPAPTTAAVSGDQSDLGTWIAGATPAESIHAVFG